MEEHEQQTHTQNAHSTANLTQGSSK